MRAFEEEIFGPVACVTAFDSDDEAVALANQHRLRPIGGRASPARWTAPSASANSFRWGLIHINDQTVADDFVNPFGGVGASGNGGRHGGPANWEEFTHWQWVTIKDQATPYPF